MPTASSTSDAPIRVTDDTLQELVDTEPLLLLHFRADWCGPCNVAVEPVLADIAQTYADDLTVGIIDAEEGQAAIDAFDIETLLTTILLADGDEVARFPGKTPYVQLERAIETRR